MVQDPINYPEHVPIPSFDQLPEKIPDSRVEQTVEAPKAAPAGEKINESVDPSVASLSASVTQTTAFLEKDADLLAVETALAEGLEEIYAKMPPSKQAEFRKKGEETAKKIKQMMDQAKLGARKVLGLIRDWLRLIPGVSKFFLEQEAKIKTDRIMEIAERKQIGNIK